MKFRYICVAGLTLLALLGRAPVIGAQSQTTGAVGGRVVESGTNQVVEGANVVLRNRRNGVQKGWTTGGNGRYVFSLLPPGRYDLRATKSEYDEKRYPAIEVPLNKPMEVVPDFQLMRITKGATTPNAPGPAIARPIVLSLVQPPQAQPLQPIQTYCRTPIGGVSLVSLYDWALRSNVDSCTIRVLPLRGSRSFDQLALFTAGVSRAPFSAGEGPAVGIGVGSIGQFSVHGLRSRSNNFTVDGSDNNDEDIGVRRQGFVALVPQSIESVDEFQIMTAGFPADFGRNAGSMVNAVSRSGEASIHGSLYGFFNDDGLNARNPFDTVFVDSINAADRNGGRFSGKNSTSSRYGGVIGGPIVVERLFYFVSAEHQRAHGVALRHFGVPAAGERGLRVNSAILTPEEEETDNGFVPIDNLRDFFQLRSIPYSSEAGKGIFSLYPLPNNPAGPFGEHNYSQVSPFEANGSAFSNRVDWYPGAYSIGARYNFTGDDSRLPFTGDGINSAIATQTRTQNFSLLVNKTEPTSANALRLSYGRTHLSFPPEKGSPLLFGSSAAGAPRELIRTVRTSYGEFGPFGVTGPIGQLMILPYAPVGVDVYNFPQGRVNNTYQVSDFITRIRDAHTIKLGFDIRHSQLNSFADRNSRPLIVFGFGTVSQGCLQNPFCAFATKDGKLKGTDLAALGAPSGVLQAISTDPLADTTIGLRLSQYDLFFQDDWSVRSNLKLNLGLRYELQTVPHETNNRIEKTFELTPAQFAHLQPVGSPADQAVIRSGNRAFDEALLALQAFLDGRQRIYEADRNNFAPRVGFAWDPFGQGKTAIHAGFSVQFDANPAAFTSQSRNVFPTFVPVNLDLNFLPPSGVVINNPTFVRFPLTQSPLIKPETLNVYNLSGDAFATGLGLLFNQQPANPTGDLSGNGLAFTLPEKKLRTGSASQYLLSAEQQFGTNWLASAAYVGTRGLHLPRFATPNGGLISTPRLLSSGSEPLRIRDLPPHGERPTSSLGAFTVMENSASSSYHSMQLSVLRRSTGGLDFRSSWTWSHAIDEVSDMFDGRSFFALPEDSAQLHKERASANFDVRHRFVGFVTWNGFRQWEMGLTAEYQTGAPYTINTVVDQNGDGNLTDRPGLGRNTARAAGIRSIDTAISRRFELSNDLTIQAGVEAFNIFNHNNPGIPVRIIEAPGFGRSFDTQVEPRTIRVTTKLSF